MERSQVWVLGTPVYWWGPTAQFKAFLDRWYGVEKALRDMPDKHIILAHALESEKEKTARHTVAILTESVQWVGKTVDDVLLALHVEHPGDVRNYPEVLERAYQAGRRAVL